MKRVASAVGPWRALLTAALIAATATPATAKTLSFAGRTWTVRPDGIGGPRANRWCEANAFVDEQGRLHLKFTKIKVKGKPVEWCAAQVATTDRLGFGTYQWQLDSRVDRLDRNIVLGLFNYPPPEVGPDGTNEIDIEFAKWGRRNADQLNYTIFPRLVSGDMKTIAFPIAMDGDFSTHRFIWTADKIRFQSTHGHYDDNPLPIADWTYAPRKPARQIPAEPMPVYINLWKIAPPADGQPVEIVVSDFRFTPS